MGPLALRGKGPLSCTIVTPRLASQSIFSLFLSFSLSLFFSLSLTLTLTLSLTLSHTLSPLTEQCEVNDFSRSFANGLVFCAMMHGLFPDAVPFHTLTASDRRTNFTLAFEVSLGYGYTQH